MRARIVVALLCVAAGARSSAHDQEPAHQVVADPLDPESLTFAEENEVDAEWRLDRLNEMLEHPLDLNTAALAELSLVPGFDRKLVIRILEYRASHRFLTIEELLKIAGINEPLLAHALPFITVTVGQGAQNAPRITGSLRSRAEASLLVVPDEGGGVAGSRWKIVQRLMLERAASPTDYRGLALGGAILIEKDAGEPRMADHMSGFFHLEQRGLELVLGDFAVDGALGLAMGSRGLAGKGTEVLSPSRWKSLSLRPRVSSSESAGLRGIAVGFRATWFEAAAFYSNRGIHARLDESSVVTSLYEAGLFRNPSEEAMRFRTRQRVLGLRATARPAGMAQLGLTVAESKFLHPLQGTSFGEGKTNRFTIIAADAFIELGRLEIAAEVARDGKGNRGLNLAIEAEISRSLDAIVMARSAGIGFVSLLGSPMADRAGSPGGESGIYLGMRWKIHPRVTLSVFADQISRERGGPGGLASRGADLFGKIEASFSRTLKLALQARERIIADGLDATDVFGRNAAENGDRSTLAVRVSFAYQPESALRLKSLLEMRDVRPPTVEASDRGFAMIHEVSWKPFPSLVLDLRAASFETDSYASRLYGWERGVRGAMVQTLYSGAGFRWSALARFSFGTTLTAEVKYSETDRTTEEESDGRVVPRRFERRYISAQMEICF